MRTWLVASLLVGGVFGCGDDSSTPNLDAAPAADTTTGDSTVQLPWLKMGEPPVMAPSIEPGDDVPCPVGEAHFATGTACATIGAPCPAGEYAEAPVDTPVVYVQPGASGGDGSLASPFGSHTEVAFGRLTRGTAVLLAAGTHEGLLRLPTGITVAGVCAGRTVLTEPPTPMLVPSLVSTLGIDAAVAGLRIAPSTLIGVRLTAGQSLRLEGVEVSGAVRSAIEVRGGLLEADGLALRDSVSAPGTDTGGGFVVLDAGRLMLSRVVVERTFATGLFVHGSGSTATLRDVVVRDTSPTERAAMGGWGTVIGDGGRLEATSALVERNHATGVVASSGGATVDLEDVVVRDTRPRPSTLFGRGLEINFDASLRLSRAVVERNLTTGIIVQEGSSVSLSDVRVRETLPQVADDGFGRGVTIQNVATATLERTVIETSHQVGLFVGASETTATLTDVAINDTRSTASDGRGGRALEVVFGAGLAGTRVLLARNRNIAVHAGAATVELAELVTLDVEPPTCTEPNCLGHGIASTSGGVVRVDSFLVDGASHCGAIIASTASDLDLTDGEIARSAIGACIQQDGFDLGRVSSTVRFRDNETNLQTTSLPVPEPIETL